MAPALFIYTAFWIFAIIAGLGLATVKWSGYGSISWAGLSNFENLFRNNFFWISLRNNFSFAFYNVTIGVFLGLLTALILDRIRFGRLFFQVTSYLPVVLSWIVVAFLVRWFLNPVYGLMGPLLELIGLEEMRINWLADIGALLNVIIALGIWKGYPVAMVLLYAALQEIPRELKDAAYIDGADELRTTVYIVLPLLQPVLAVVISLALINSFRVFEPFYVLGATGGQQANPLLDVLSTMLYRRAFGQGEIGMASTIGFVLFALTMFVSIFYLKTLGRTETGEEVA